MPIYEYQCSACHEHIERLQKLNDTPLVTCPACHQDTLARQISLAGFRLKGGGWYETDFKKDKQKNLSDAGKKTTSGDTPTKETKKSAATDTTTKKKTTDTTTKKK